ncbi:hypothetical protein LZ30DRAFT_473910 [Colletotrichum cereale]|nr:hypothetical protein LZ30DRAFT_473910 [Colletotrichum cereale]
MAEPVGITGTAAGLVSLGLQLYGEISKYLSAVKGRQKDLDRARRHHQNLQRCIDAIAAATSSSRVNNAQTNTALKSCVLSCNVELRALEALVARLQGPSTPSGGVLSAKLGEKGRQYAFPFHRESILELERTLESTNGVLQTALQTLGLDVSIGIQDAVSSIMSDLTLAQVAQEDTSTNISSMAQSVNNVFTSVSQIEQIVPNINAQIASTSAMMVQHSATWSRTTDISTRTEENTKNIMREVSLVRHQQTRIEEILIGMARRSVNPGAQEVEVARLVAKPADLKTMCDAILQPQAQMERIATSSNPSMRDQLCPCVRRRSLQREERSWGPIVFTKVKRLTKHHLPGCPWLNLAPPECRQTRDIRFKLRDIGPLLEGAIHLTWSLSFGAGGLSIKHGINWNATVSEDCSPVFKIGRTLLMGLMWEFYDFKEKKRFVEECLKSILWCYSQKLACPSDVDDRGASLPTRLLTGIIPISSTDTGANELLAGSALRLTLLNIPFVGDDHTLSKLYSRFLDRTWPRMSNTPRLLVQRLSSATGFIPPKRDYMHDLSSAVGLLMRMQHSLYLADLVECGSLALSILREDEMAVSQTLKTYPYASNEANSLGQTPCHIAVAVGNLRILETVLLYTSPDVLNTPDNSGDYPVDYALADSIHEVCLKSQTSTICNGCKILEMVLDLNCALYPRTLHYALCAQSLARSTRKIIIRYLRPRRKAFETLALSFLSPTEASSLGIHPSRVLDKNAEQVQRHLDARSCPIPNHLRIYGSDTHESFREFFSPVYDMIYEKDVAAFAWSQGFKDIDIQPFDTNHSIQMRCYDTDERPRRTFRETLMYVSYLGDHQTDTNITAWAHDFMGLLGDYVREYQKDTFTLTRTLSNAVFYESVTDGCLCYCSSGGCTPFDIFLCRAILNILHQVTDIPISESIDITAIKLSQYSETGRRVSRTVRGLIGRKRYRSEQYAWLHQAILRQLTFFVLGLSHTCCNYIIPGKYWGTRQKTGLDVEDAEEIHEEDREKLQLLEDLMVEFTQECGCNMKLLAYLQDGWTRKMQSVMQDLASRRLSQVDRWAAEDVGVVWEDGEAEDSSGEFPDIVEKWQPPSLESCMGTLRRIVPEHNISLPPGLQF